jgi:aspartate aminotransferase
MKIASRIGLIKPSPTLTIQAKANALKAAGRDIIGFGAGEPPLTRHTHPLGEGQHRTS